MKHTESDLLVKVRELHKPSDWTPELKKALGQLLAESDDRTIREFFELLCLRLEPKFTPEQRVVAVVGGSSPRAAFDTWEAVRYYVEVGQIPTLADVVGDAKAWSDEVSEKVEYWIEYNSTWLDAAVAAQLADHREYLFPDEASRVLGIYPTPVEVAQRLAEHYTPAILGQMWPNPTLVEAR